MKRLICAILTAGLILSMFCVSFTSYAEGVTITFHSNNSSAASESFQKSAGEVGNMYDLPDVGNGFIFKGWYYGKSDDAQPVDFANDTFSKNTDVYAHWADKGIVSADALDEIGTGFYDGFDLVGVQQRAGVLSSENGGLRFIGVVSNSLLSELDSLLDSVVAHENDGEPTLTYGSDNRVEYGFIGASYERLNAWKNSAYAPANYELGYKGANVNGTNTREHNSNYQPVINIDCTASDYSDSSVTDFKSYNDYRLYSLAVTYDNSADKANESIDIRAYMRYYDANGLLRTVYDDYDGTNNLGGLCTSYNAVESAVVSVGYYSSVADMFGDANNGTVANGDCAQSNAVCSMYISGGRAYMKLLSNASLTGDVTLNANINADFNLNGFTLSENSYRIKSYADFSMSNGSVETASSANGFCLFSGGIKKLADIEFSSINLITSAQFTGVYAQSSAEIYLTDCSFDIDYSNSQGICYLNCFNGSKRAVVSDCEYNVDASAARVSGVYSLNSSLTLRGSSPDDTVFNIDSDNVQTIGVGVQAWGSDNAYFRNTKMAMTGDYNILYGALVSKVPTDETVTERFFEADSFNLDAEINNLYIKEGNDVSTVRGLCVAGDEKAVIRNVKTDITVTDARDASVYGICGENNADITASGIDIDINTENNAEDSYRLNGIITVGTAKLLLKSGEINVLPVLDIRNGTGNAAVERNTAIRADGTSEVTIDPVSDNDINLQGGNTALSNGTDAVFTITGGNFRSPSHGGAYMGGNAEITGGKFYSYYLSGHTEEGAFYVTYNAIVNISNAQIISNDGMHGLRTRDNKDENGNMVYGNPVVNVTDTLVKANVVGVSASSGTIYLNSGVVIQAGRELEGNVVDNRQ